MRVAPLNLKVMAHVLELAGYDKDHAFQRCGLVVADFNDENGEWVPLTQFAQLLDAMLVETQDPAFGLIAGKSLALALYGLLNSVALFTPNLRQLLTDIDRFAMLVLERAEFALEEGEQHAFLHLLPIIHEGTAGRFRMDFVATSIVQMLRFLGMKDSDLHSIDLPFSCEPELRPRYEGYFGPKVRFQQRSARICFNPALLDAPHIAHDQLSYAAALTGAELALATVRSRIDVAERVRQSLLSAFPRQPGIAETARQLGMSERSLRRKLSDLETSYQTLAQDCQFARARSLLAEGHLSIKEIADALGFSSVASFHRAFKRWTGCSPVLWRDLKAAS